MQFNRTFISRLPKYAAIKLLEQEVGSAPWGEIVPKGTGNSLTVAGSHLTVPFVQSDALTLRLTQTRAHDYDGVMHTRV